MSFKTGAPIIKRILCLLLLIVLLLPLGISAQSNQASVNKPTSVPNSDNTALINDLKEKLRNAEFEYQKASNYQQFLANTANQYTDLNTVFEALNNALYWSGKVYEYKTELTNLGYYSTSVPTGNFNINYDTMRQNNTTKNTLHLEKVTCSFCHGTGESPIKEYPPNYGLGNNDDNHYHKVCPSCLGIGYIEKYVP